MTGKVLILLCVLVASLPADAGNDASQRWTNLRRQINDLLIEGRTEESIQMLEQAIEAARKRGDNGPLLARALNDLGSLYADTYRLKEADRCYAGAMSILDVHEASAIRIVVYGNLAGLRLKQGRYTEAERFFRNAQQLASAGVSDDRSALARIYNGLAEVSLKTRRYADATRFAERGMAETFPDQESRGDALFLLARIAAEQGSMAEAESLLHRAVDAWDVSVGTGHPSYASGLAGLAVLLSAKRPSDSEQLFRRALQIAEANFGRMHPYYAQIMLQYSTLLESCGRRKEADKLRRRAEKTLSEQALRNRIGFTVDVQTLRAP